ncbi:MAG: response regulator transcription factor [Planctomycetota bacterium]
MKKRTILVIEDDAAIRGGIVDALAFEGFATLEAADGTQGLNTSLSAEYDLLLLDLVLPGPGGLEILKALRAARPLVPVIILTARGGEADRVTGLKLGADDYVVKPFSIHELTARIEAVLRRTPGRPMDLSRVEVPGGEVDLDESRIFFNDRETCELSEKEAQLLRYLACNANRVISREEILARVWGIPSGVETRTIDMHIARLREKLRDNPSRPVIIRTVRGKGYQFFGKKEAP